MKLDINELEIIKFNEKRYEIEKEKIYQTIAGKTNDYKEGTDAFLQKRKPNFKGE